MLHSTALLPSLLQCEVRCLYLHPKGPKPMLEHSSIISSRASLPFQMDTENFPYRNTLYGRDSHIGKI